MLSTMNKAALVTLIVGLIVGFTVGAAQASHAEPGQSDGKVYVCKYVGQPGVDEVLQTGQNPIEVSVNALEGDGFAGVFPFEFSDAQGRSVAIGFSGEGHAELTIEDCPAPVEPTPTPSPTPTPTPTPTPEPPTDEWTPNWEPDNDGSVPPIGEAPPGDLAETGNDVTVPLIAGGVLLALGLGALAYARKGQM